MHLPRGVKICTVLFLLLGWWLKLVLSQPFSATLSGIFAPLRSPHNACIAAPVWALLAFACFSVAAIAWKVLRFNDCVASSDELRKQIKDARKELTEKGFKWD